MKRSFVRDCEFAYCRQEKTTEKVNVTVLIQFEK